MTHAAAQTDLGLYVHIPFCLRKCPYCAFYSEPITQHDPRPLIEAILAELERIRPVEPVRTIYLGGGSPSCLPVEMLCGLIKSICDRVGSPEELTVECNPAQAGPALFQSLRRCGVNRLSIGAQSFHPDELKTLGRPHSPQAITTAVADARSAGFENIGLDLIFGIPGSTLDTCSQSLETAVALKPNHLSAYSLTWEDGTPLTRAMADGRLLAVGEDEERAMYQRLCQMLTAAGYAQYEISNFAQAGCECRHNLRYWNNRPVVGLGPAASGWYRGQRTTNIADIHRYIERIRQGRLAHDAVEHPDPLQIAAETAILGLRLTDGIDLPAFQRTTGCDAAVLFADAIAAHRQAGLLEITPTRLRLTEIGRSFADTVACDFVSP